VARGKAMEVRGSRGGRRVGTSTSMRCSASWHPGESPRELQRAASRLCCEHVRRVVPLLLVLLTAAPQAALAGQWYRCRYSGVTRKSCCCGEKAQREPPRQAEVRRSSCCDVLRNHPRVVNARAEASAERVTPAMPRAVHPVAAHALVLVRGYELDPIERATAPPPATPAYIRHSALLL
jgi:hypothetical protein